MEGAINAPIIALLCLIDTNEESDTKDPQAHVAARRIAFASLPKTWPSMPFGDREWMQISSEWAFQDLTPVAPRLHGKRMHRENEGLRPPRPNRPLGQTAPVLA